MNVKRVARRLGVVMLAVVAGVSVTIGCSQPTRNRLMALFFEIPPEETPPPAANRTQQTRRAKLPEPLTLPPTRFASIHPPVLMRKCTACHDVSTKMPPTGDLAAACKPCHEDYFSERVRHEPVAQGACGACHEMHRSAFRNLLHQPVFDTCLECHDEPEDLSEDAHGVTGVEGCTNCHNPHFGAERLLRPDYKRFMIRAPGDDDDDE